MLKNSAIVFTFSISIVVESTRKVVTIFLGTKEGSEDAHRTVLWTKQCFQNCLPNLVQCTHKKKIIWDEYSTGHQTIILGLEIFLDQLSSRTIDQKFLMIYLVHLSSLEVDMDQFEVCLVYSVRWSGWSEWSGWSSKFILIHQSSS